jgi:carboxymethylenebutenolidase
MTDIQLPYFFARPAGDPPWPGVVVIQEANGMTAQLLRFCQKLAKEGYATLAPDLYWRHGGTESADYMTLVQTVDLDELRADLEASVAYLHEHGADKVGITGFCMGGGYAYLAATSGDVDAAVPFYGAGIAQHLGDAKCPLLAFFGGDDEWIPRADIAKVEQHHPGDVVVYEDARHGFMRDGSDTYHETAAPEAWQRMLAFFDQHLREH